jgi:hypothetical protein
MLDSTLGERGKKKKKKRKKEGKKNLKTSSYGVYLGEGLELVAKASSVSGLCKCTWACAPPSARNKWHGFLFASNLTILMSYSASSYGQGHLLYIC